MAATTSTTSSCSGNFFNLRSNNVEPRAVVRPSSSSSSSSTHGVSPAATGCGGKLDGVAMWFINGVATAFFASLQRCSCIRIATEEEEDGEETNDVVPLIHSDGIYVRHEAGNISKRRIRKSIS